MNADLTSQGGTTSVQTVEQQAPTPTRGIGSGDLTSRIRLTIILMSTGYLACLLSGFGAFLEHVGPFNLRALPLFLYAALLLVTLQGQIINETNSLRKRKSLAPISTGRVAFTWVITSLALLYALWAFFLKGPGNPLQYPETYIVMNALALAGFLYEFFEPVAEVMGLARPVRPPRQADGTDDGDVAERSLVWTSKAGSLSAFTLLAALLLYVLANGLTLPVIGTVLPSYLTVPLWQIPILTIRYLPDLDIAIGLFAAFVSLVLLGFAFALDANRRPAIDLWARAGWVVRTAFKQSSYSFRFAISPLIWVVPAFSIAAFAQQATDFFSHAATARSGSIWDFFNPFSATSMTYLVPGLGDLVLAVAAIAAVLFAVAAYEFDTSIIVQALRLASAAGRIFVYFFPVFLLSLTVLNAALAFLFPTMLWPFQLSVATLVTTLLALLYLVISSIQPRPNSHT